MTILSLITSTRIFLREAVLNTIVLFNLLCYSIGTKHALVPMVSKEPNSTSISDKQAGS